LKITFLGTGTSQGVPLIGCECAVCLSTDAKDKRLRSSVLVENNGDTIVIDSGPDFRQQMLREHVKKLDAVVFTHEHKDHIAGLDDVRAYNYWSGKEMDVYATERVQQALKREYAYIFSGVDYPGIPKIKLHAISHLPFQVSSTLLTPIEVFHMHLPVLGFRIADFTYITDANYIADAEKEKIKGSKVIVLNALRRDKHVSHYSLDEAIELLTELKPERAYLVHISHQLGKHADLEKELPPFVRCAYDGLKIEVQS
jgi:phosphoribosyl 1,2-cyclic phosphate phosphodiesterase